MTERCCNRKTSAGDAREEKDWARPALDLLEFDDRYELHADVPGTTADGLTVTLEDGVLTIEARVSNERGEAARPLLRNGVERTGFRRSLRLGEDIEHEGLSARLRDGVLGVTLPKSKARRPRRIPIEAC